MSSLPQLQLGGRTVSKSGFGLMQLTWNPAPPPEEESFAAMKAAADAGATAWSSATFYGPPNDPYANVKLIARFFDKYPEYSDKVTLVIKGGILPSLVALQAAELEKQVRSEVSEIHSILGKARGIDVYCLARLHPQCEVEDAMRVLKGLQDEGLLGPVGVSEMKGETVERALKVIDVACLEIEVSLWSYEDDIKGALAVAAKHRIPVLAYSPLGRGFITRKFKTPEDIPEGSFQRHVPRFQGEAFYKNLELVDKLDEVAERKGVSTSALALAWVAGLNAMTIPIAGTSNAQRARDNTEAAGIKLSEEELKGVNDILASFPPSGGRYPEGAEAVLMR